MFLPIEQPLQLMILMLGATTLSSSQPDSNLVNVSSPLPDRASGISSLLTSKPSQTLVFLGANLNLFHFRHHTLGTH